MKIGIIGSGPTGWAIYKAFENSGHSLTLIDSDLNEKDIHNVDLSNKLSVNKKLYFNSDLPYRQFPHGPYITKKNVNPINSFASGGFSLIWGATMLPYSKKYTSDLSLSSINLNSYYEKICHLIPVCGRTDDLSEEFQNFFSRPNIIPSQRVVRILEKYNSKIKNLKGLKIGLSRLAVETGTNSIKGCVYCNKCLEGCPQNLIWNSKGAFNDIKKVKMRVLNLEEYDDFVNIHGVDIDGNPVTEFKYDRVFLGCGPLETFRILAESGYVEPKALLNDSATFYIPIFASSKLGSYENNSFALSQLTIHLFNNKNEYQFQIYEMSASLQKKIKDSNAILRLIPDFILKFIFSKFLIAIGYIDSDNSPKIQMYKKTNGSIELSLEDAKKQFILRRKSIKEAVSILKEKINYLGLYPLYFAHKPLKPGEGVHFGSWLPMGSKSDNLGRPNKLKRIYVADSSVLPNIAAGPITFTIMANAMRIAHDSISCE